MRLAIPGLAIGLWVIGLCLAGCDPTGAACDFRKGSVNGAQQRCQDYHNLPTYNRQRTACDESKAQWLDTPCPREIAVGGCMTTPSAGGYQGAGFFQIDWYYPEPGRTVESVKMTCAQMNESFITP
mgnify:CR=1 FL=1